MFAARAASQLGDGIFQLATAEILLFEDPGDNPAARLAVITAITLVPFSLIGPFGGVFIDRWDRRGILARTPAVRAVLAALVPVFSTDGWSSIGFYAAVLLVLSANRFFLSTISAVLPQLVPEEDLLVANSVSTTGGSITNTLGLGIGAAVSEAWGGEWAALVAAAAFAGGALLARRIPVHRGHDANPAPLLAAVRAIAGEITEGIRAVRRSRRVTYALSAVTVTQVLVGAMAGAITHYFIAVLGLSVGSATGLLGLVAVGIFAGVVLVPFAARRIHPDRLIPLSYGIALVAVFASGANLSRPSVIAGGVVVGVAYAFAKIPVDTIVQEEIADAYRGRAFSAYDMLFNLARVGGVSAVAAAVPRAGDTADLVLGIAGAYALALVGFGLWSARLGRVAVS